jgi:transcriptional regulator with XRE-family HTH domain
MQESRINKLYQDIGSRIRETREINGITQELLSEQLGLSRASIINIEKGRHKPSLHQLMDIAEMLKVHFTTLIPQGTFTPTIVKAPFDLDDYVSDQKLSKHEEAQMKHIISSL